YRLPAMFITGEMNSWEIQTRILSAESRVPLQHMRTGYMADDERERLARVMKSVHDSPIHIATPPEFQIEQVSTNVHRLVEEAGLKLVLIDSLQWATESEPSSQASLELTLRRLKKLAATARIPIIVAAHAEKIRQGPEACDPISVFINSDAIER